MDRFFACGACQCLVKRADATCPFCGSAVAAPITTADAPRRVRRISRGRWLAVGTLCTSFTAAACLAVGETSSSSLVNEAGDSADEPTNIAAPDASHVDMLDGAAEAARACTVTSGGRYGCAQGYTDECSFEAGVDSTDCQMKSQVCYASSFGKSSLNQCGSHFVTCLDLGSTADVAALERLGFDRKCLAACPSCACGPKVLSTRTGESASCQDLPDGGMMVTDFVAGGGCYGSPPARIALV